jgi:hypothetical protein
MKRLILACFMVVVLLMGLVLFYPKEKWEVKEGSANDGNVSYSIAVKDAWYDEKAEKSYVSSEITFNWSKAAFFNNDANVLSVKCSNNFYAVETKADVSYAENDYFGELGEIRNVYHPTVNLNDFGHEAYIAFPLSKTVKLPGTKSVRIPGTNFVDYSMQYTKVKQGKLTILWATDGRKKNCKLTCTYGTKGISLNPSLIIRFVGVLSPDVRFNPKMDLKNGPEATVNVQIK